PARAADRVVAGTLTMRRASSVPITASNLRMANADPFPTAGRPASTPTRTHADPLAGTETFIQKFPDAFRAGIREVLERNGGFEAQRRGVVTSEDTARLADGLAVDASRRLKAG